MTPTDIDDLVFMVANAVYEIEADTLGLLSAEDLAEYGPRVSATVDRKLDKIREIGEETKRKITSDKGFDDECEGFI
jgi:hypothetical protein